MTLGLYQGDKLDAAAMLAHQRALNDAFLPQLAKRIEDQLRTAQKDNLEFTYEALKTYLMLHQPEHFDADALKAWITLDWARSLDRGIPEDQRKLLEDHLDVLIAQGPPRSPLKMDENLVRSVRADARELSAGAARLQPPEAPARRPSDIPPFTVATAAGPSAPLVFERTSGKPLTEGVPGLFTYDGYHKRFQNEVTVLTGLLAAEEPWVLGQERGAADRLRDAAALGALTDRVRAPLPRGIRQGVGGAAGRRAPGARHRPGEEHRDRAHPLGRRLAARRLPARGGEGDDADPGRGRQGRGEQGHASTVRNTRASLENLFGTEPDKRGGAAASASRASSTTTSSRCAASSPRARRAARRRSTMRSSSSTRCTCTSPRSTPRSRAARSPPPGDVAGKLKAEAGRLPEPVRSMVENLSQAGAAQARVAERGNLSQDLRPVTEFCQRAIAGRYPFVPTSKRDVLPEDFGQMFGPGGLMDDFFQKRLAPHGRHQHAAVALQAGGRAAARSRAQALAQFERAGAHQGHLLPRRRPRPGDAAGLQAGRDGCRHHAVHPRRRRPAREVRARPGGADGGAVARPQGQQPGARAGQPAVGHRQLGHDGRRALGAVPRAGRRRSSKPATRPRSSSSPSRSARRKTRFEVTTNSVQHPIRLRELREFACPEGL